jgi:hypothetical protein
VGKCWIPVFALTVCLAPVTIARAAKNAALRVHVSFLAVGSSVHSLLAHSEDIYLVELRPRDSAGEPILALLIDEYPSYRAPIPSETQKSASGLSLRVTRDHSCDARFADVPLRAAPGDPLARLPEPMSYTPRLPRAVDPGETLPCYRVLKR